MKRIGVFSVAFLFFLRPASGQAQEVFQKCGMEGTATSSDGQALNRLKNRYTVQTDAQIDPSITLEAMLAPGDDTHRWNASQVAEITGYVVGVTVGGIESANCNALDWRFRDTHVDLVLDPRDTAENRRVIVEVTPRWRAIKQQEGLNWSTDGLRRDLLGRWVRVRGWMLFDAGHSGESENSAPRRAGNWRATAWEIHPVTDIEVLPTKPQ